MMMSPAASATISDSFSITSGHVPDHLREIAVLADLAVALERDAALLRMADLGGRTQRAAGRRGVERLADLPGALDVARGDLQVAPGEVDADAVAPDQVVGALSP